MAGDVYDTIKVPVSTLVNLLAEVRSISSRFDRLKEEWTPSVQKGTEGGTSDEVLGNPQPLGTPQQVGIPHNLGIPQVDVTTHSRSNSTTPMSQPMANEGVGECERSDDILGPHPHTLAHESELKERRGEEKQIESKGTLCPNHMLSSSSCYSFCVGTLGGELLEPQPTALEERQEDEDLHCEFHEGGLERNTSSDMSTHGSYSSGNSGGPLVNVDGEVIGVNIMKVLAADGLGFAVPIDSATKIIDHFKKRGRVIRPWLGLKMLDLNDTVVAQLQDRDPSFPKVKKGVLVSMVTPGSPADRAGFQPSDVVVEFDGKLVGSIKEIVDIMGDNIGKQLTVVVKRASNVTATLTVIPEEANPDM